MNEEIKFYSNHKFRLGYIKVLFHRFYYYWGKENLLLCRALLCWGSTVLVIFIIDQLFYELDMWATKEKGQVAKK